MLFDPQKKKVLNWRFSEEEIMLLLSLAKSMKTSPYPHRWNS